MLQGFQCNHSVVFSSAVLNVCGCTRLNSHMQLPSFVFTVASLTGPESKVMSKSDGPDGCNLRINTRTPRFHQRTVFHICKYRTLCHFETLTLFVPELFQMNLRRPVTYFGRASIASPRPIAAFKEITHCRASNGSPSSLMISCTSV